MQVRKANHHLKGFSPQKHSLAAKQHYIPWSSAKLLHIHRCKGIKYSICAPLQIPSQIPDGSTSGCLRTTIRKYCIMDANKWLFVNNADVFRQLFVKTVEIYEWSLANTKEVYEQPFVNIVEVCKQLFMNKVEYCVWPFMNIVWGHRQPFMNTI